MPTPSVSSNGVYRTVQNDLPINTNITLVGTGPLLLVLEQHSSDPGFGMITPKLDGVDMTQVGSTNGRLSKFIAVTTAGVRTITTRNSGGAYDAHEVSWRTWQDTATSGARYQNPQSHSGTNQFPTTGSLTCPSGGALDAGYVHLYSTAQPTIGAGCTEYGSTRNTGTGSSWGGGVRFSTGAIMWTATDANAWFVNSLEILGDAPAGPVITGPSGAAGAASSTANVAEGASTGPTFSTSIALGTGYPTLTGTDASLWTLTSLTSTSWRVDPSPAKNFESPTDAGANNVHDVVFNASATVSQSCAITITNVNEAPTFTGAISVPTLTQSVAMTPVSFASLFGDPDAGDTATYSQIGTWPDGVAIAGTTIAGTPTTVGTSSNLRVRRTDALGLTVDSNLFSIQVDAAGAAPTVATQPSNQTADEGTTATFTAAFDNSPTAFAWQYADAPYSSWAAVSGGSGAATASYTTAALIAGMNGRRFRCTATNAFGSVVTDGAAQLTVNPVAGAGTITTDPFREWGDTNDWAPGTIIDYVWIERLADAVNVQTLTAQALNPSSRLILSGAGIVSGQDYLVRARLADGSALGYKKYTAA